MDAVGAPITIEVGGISHESVLASPSTVHERTIRPFKDPGCSAVDSLHNPRLGTESDVASFLRPAQTEARVELELLIAEFLDLVDGPLTMRSVCIALYQRQLQDTRDVLRR